MEDQELERLFDDLESDRIERKSSVATDKDKICEAIKRELKNNGNPPPEFVVKDTHITVVLRKKI
jgi:hypothetical protein